MKKILFAFSLVAILTTGFRRIASADPCTTPIVSSVTLTAPSAFSSGVPSTATMTFTVGGPGLVAGDLIAMKVPDGWPSPTMSATAAGGGSVSFASTVTATLGGLTMNTSGQMVLIVATGPVSAGVIIRVQYVAQVCEAGTLVRFRPLTRPAGCLLLREIFSTDPSFTRPTVVGPPSFVQFDNYNLTALADSITPIGLRVTDACNHVTQSTASIPLTIGTIDGTTFIPDADALGTLDTSPTFASAARSTISKTIPSNSTGTQIYYRIQSTNFVPTKSIKLSYFTLQPPSFALDSWATITNVTSGITNASVDSGTPGTLTTATFTPDQDGTDDFAYVNFQLPSDQSWQVLISSASDFSAVTRTFYGNGRSNRISWDGFTDWTPNSNPRIAEPGTYYAKILMGSLSNATLLRINLVSAGVKGIVTDAAHTPLDKASVQLFGPAGRFAMTDSSGGFKLFGVQPGDYTLQVDKTGYASYQTKITISAGNTLDLTSTPIAMDSASILRVEVARSTSSTQDVWGGVSANTTDWQFRSYGTVHFLAASTSSDAGDFYNLNYSASLTSYTALSLLPGKVYRLHFDIPGYGIDDSTVSLNVGEIRDLSLSLTRRAVLSGILQLPAGFSLASFGGWVSVEAGPDANFDGIFDNNDVSKRYYGGAGFQANISTAMYSIYGVKQGSYTLVARAPGLASVKVSTFVTDGVDANLDFPTMTVGGQVKGTITINGDSTSIPGVSLGQIPLPISIWSPVTYIGSFQQVMVTVDPNVATATFSVTGLDDGVYNVWVNLPGFESSPPGQKIVTVTSGLATLNLTFNQFSGSLAGTVTLPGGNTDFNNVEIEVLSFNGPTSQHITKTLTTSNYSITGLGTGFFTVRALYKRTGFIVEKNLQIVNGKAAALDIDLRGNTFSISGHVTTSAPSPYNLLSNIVNFVNASSATLYTQSGSSDVAPNRIIARKFNGRSFQSPTAVASRDPDSIFDSKTDFFGYYDSTGDYQIPNLTPGVYVLSNNAEFDGDFSNGREIAEDVRVVTVSTYDLTGQNFNLTNGFTVSGKLTIDSGISETARTVQVSLSNASGEAIETTLCYFSGATSVDFSLSHIPSGVYVLHAEDFENPKKYSAKDLSIEVKSADITNQELRLLDAAKIQGQLRIKTSGILLTDKNYAQYLTSSFSVEARSNPWFPGGYGRADSPLVGSDGTFTMTVNPGTYDVVLRSYSAISDDEIAQGKRQFVPVTVSGIRVSAGQSTNVGVIDLSEGIPLSGTVTDAAGVPLPNIRVIARASGNQHNNQDDIEAFTNQLGSYTLVGLDPDKTRYYDITASPRPSSDDPRFSGYTGQRFAESRKTQVDTRKVPTPNVNFKLQLAKGSVSGVVKTPIGGSPLLLPFNHQDLDVDTPGAAIIMNKQGNIPQDNPLGDIEEVAGPDGTFSVKGLAAGVYDMWILAKSYGGAVKRNITVADTNVDVGTLTVVTGYKLTGTITQSDGSSLNSHDFDALIGVRNGFEEIVIGQFNKDASGNILSYTMSGFQPNKMYSILMFGNNGDAVVLTSSMVVTGDAIQNFVMGDVSPAILTQAHKTSGVLTIQFDFTKSLRNSDTDLDNNGTADDNEPARIIRLKTGNGTLSFGDDWLSSDRKRIVASYTPAPGESTFVLTASATFVSINGKTGLNQTLSQDFTYFVGIGKQKNVRITNANGGEVGLDDDTSVFTSQAGTFGDSADLQVNVLFRAADSASTLAGDLPIASRGKRMMKTAAALGGKAYPSEMTAAINKLHKLGIDPFSSFYDIFLPVGVSHFFPEGKAAKLCLAYDSSATDPDALNIYYYNTQSGEYLLESQNKAVDTDNQRICVDISHASVFTVLSSSQSVIAGAGYTGELAVMNFPNPFNLKSKIVTLQNPGSASASQTIEGTMIKYSVPPTMSGAVKIEIYDVAGERVRTLNDNVAAGGSHFYLEWDGRNDSGEKVASGIYVARLTIGGSNERFFKMAVVK